MMQDFSELHTLTGALGSLPEREQDWQRYRLSQNQVEAFHHDGFLTGVQVLDDHQVGSLCAELAGLMEPSHPSHELFHEYHSNESSNPDTTLFHALGAWRTGPAFHDVLWSPAFLVAASQLLEGAVRFWHDQLFCKPAHHGGVVAWHQGYSYWTRTQPMAHLTCWMALDDSTRDNGCLYYVPGSHKWNLLPITGLAGTGRTFVERSRSSPVFRRCRAEDGMADFKPRLTVWVNSWARLQSQVGQRCRHPTGGDAGIPAQP
jgi:hypothetical protein